MPDDYQRNSFLIIKYHMCSTSHLLHCISTNVSADVYAVCSHLNHKALISLTSGNVGVTTSCMTTSGGFLAINKPQNAKSGLVCS